ncbi:ABC transporter ATP-binding protein [Garciella nitratireducens]|uniref:ABC-2 type transport system ATP-binding protein n=1 Tax=Garciella nitratireducens DSM 15102 TaxID=1121911 RepID=A0A1T4NND6_9FIRM|nr:ABC transporter ATP-binding protein [Garciella nitratireducens]SJZ80723.1 ABC-2 type transport system ATP-binding protein [Garciella nitratireducens DSM 15102]
MESILEVRNLRKDFKDFSLKNISFSLDKGFIMGFIGPNGAGKSTTIKLIMNLLRKNEGEIKIFGLDHIKYERQIKERIGFVYDQNYFYEELTLSEMIKIIAPLYKNWNNSIYQRYMKEFQLPLKKKIKELSKGMKMKLSLIIALSHQAELLIMDEPTSGLDPLIRRELLQILLDLMQDENKGVFFSTHITSDLDKIADYIVLLENGEVLLNTTKEDILENYVIIKGDKKNLNKKMQSAFIGIKENSFGFEGLVKKKDNIQQRLEGNIVMEKPDLEDIMYYFTGRDLNV